MTARSAPTPDTICAIATARGEAAIGVVRLSGPEAIAAGDRILRLASGRPLKALGDRRVAFGQAVDPSDGCVIDEVLVTVMRAPRSYTREDVVELYQEIVQALNRELSQFERIKRIALLPSEFSIESGELTPTLKVKRKVVEDRWREKIEELYRD